MPLLHIEFDENGGTLFEVRFKPTSGSVWSTTTVTESPADIDVSTIGSYDYCIKKICAPDSSSIEICGVAEYRPPCETPIFEFVERNGNDFVFNFELTESQFQYDIEITRPLSAGVEIVRYQLDDAPSPLSLTLDNIVSGLYRFRLRGVCGVDVNSPASNWTEYEDVSALVSSCVAPSGVYPTTNPGIFLPSGIISWPDTHTIEDRMGSDGTLQISVDSIFDPTGSETTNQFWERSDNGGASWLIFIQTAVLGSNDLATASNFVYQFRMRVRDELNNVGYSNVLQFTKIAANKISFVRSSGFTTYTEGLCGSAMGTDFHLEMQTVPTVPTNGDRAFSFGNVPFNGGNKYYVIRSSASGIGDDSYICKIDINGYITIMFTCA